MASMTPAEWDSHFRGAGFSKRDTERLVYAVRGLVTDPAEEAAAGELLAWFKQQRQRKGN